MKELKDLIYKNISLSDFDQRFDSIDGIEEKFSFMNNYILSHGIGQRNSNGYDVVDFALEDIVAHARIRFVEAIVKEREDYELKNKVNLPRNIFDPNDKKGLQKTYASFISEPMVYIQKNAEHRKGQIKIDEDDPNKDEIEYYKMNLSRVIIHSKDVIDFDDYGNDYAIKDFNHKLGKELYNNKNLNFQDFLSHNKGGFFERLFRTTSNEYREFEETYKAFNDKTNPAYGDLDHLEAVTRNYLHYKIPNFKSGDELPKQEDINRLSGTSRKRVESLVAVLKNIKHERKLSDILDQAEEKLNDQAQFQNDLDKNLDENNNLNNNLDEIQNNISIEANEEKINL